MSLPIVQSEVHGRWRGGTKFLVWHSLVVRLFFMLVTNSDSAWMWMLNSAALLASFTDVNKCRNFIAVPNTRDAHLLSLKRLFNLGTSISRAFADLVQIAFRSLLHPRV